MTDWRSQKVVVAGKSWLLQEVLGGKLYHGSAVSLEVDTLLTPQTEDKRNFKESPADEVCFTSDRATAIYWARKAVNDMEATVYLYEVEPHSTVNAHRIMPANYGKNINLLEGRAKTATITAVHTINNS